MIGTRSFLNLPHGQLDVVAGPADLRRAAARPARRPSVTSQRSNRRRRTVPFFWRSADVDRRARVGVALERPGHPGILARRESSTRRPVDVLIHGERLARAVLLHVHGVAEAAAAQRLDLEHVQVAERALELVLEVQVDV